tara:strand:- start:361 stop:528 length:168 start_codon:yes stop_codon:yes gene_type:complete
MICPVILDLQVQRQQDNLLANQQIVGCNIALRSAWRNMNRQFRSPSLQHSNKMAL